MLHGIEKGYNLEGEKIRVWRFNVCIKADLHGKKMKSESLLADLKIISQGHIKNCFPDQDFKKEAN